MSFCTQDRRGPHMLRSHVDGRIEECAEPLTLDIMEDNLSYMRTEAPLLAPIFRSDGQARLLSALLLTGEELSITDLVMVPASSIPRTTSGKVQRKQAARMLMDGELAVIGAAGPLAPSLQADRAASRVEQRADATG